ncbi:hypothetical protein AAC387_Pa06g0263 [Persea americana]
MNGQDSTPSPLEKVTWLGNPEKGAPNSHVLQFCKNMRAVVQRVVSASVEVGRYLLFPPFSSSIIIVQMNIKEREVLEKRTLAVAGRWAHNIRDRAWPPCSCWSSRIGR